jgi:hypothetical protein
MTSLAFALVAIGKPETPEVRMMESVTGGFGEQPLHQLNATQLFAGPNDGLSQTCNGVSTFVGLQGHSRKAGYRVIFPTLDMGRYVEISEADILRTEELSPAHSPFGALGGTRVSVREAARILTSTAVSQTQEVDDEFDLDIRLEASSWGAPGMHGGPNEAIYAPGYEGEERQANPEDPEHGKHHTKGEHHTCHTCETCQTCETVCAGCKPTITPNSCCKEDTCI